MNIWNLEISWDFDQVLLRSEIPVLEFVDNKLGTRYAGRKIKGWNSVAGWLVADGIMQPDKANDFENYVWTEPSIISKAPVNGALQALSYVAWQRGIPQTITTSRIPKLADTTFEQVEKFFPWLQGRVNQRIKAVPGVSGEDYKVEKVSDRFKHNSNLVHHDDSMTFMRKLLSAVPGIDVIGFPCEEDYHLDLIGGRRVFFPDISLFNALVYYPEVNVAQSS